MLCVECIIRGLSVNPFASCTVDYVENIITSSKDVKEIVIYSDGCTYKNRNDVLANALSKTAVDNDVVNL